MIGKRRLKATFYLPLRDNDGRDLADDIAVVADECFVAFDGWTWVGEFRGAWRMTTGVRQVDTCAVYFVIIDEDQLARLKKILAAFKAGTTQESIYLEVDHDIDVEFL